MDDNHNVGDDDDDDGREEELYNRPKKSHKRFDLILFSSAIVKGGSRLIHGDGEASLKSSLFLVLLLKLPSSMMKSPCVEG